MNKNFLKLAKTCLLLGGLLAMPMDVFAEGNPYGIQYSGGEVLSASNIQINPSLTSELTPLVVWKRDDSNVQLKFSTSNLWRDGYIKANTNGDCVPVRYFRIYKNDQLKASDDLSFSISNNRYTTNVKINDVLLEDVEGLSEDGKGMAVIVSMYTSNLNARYNIFSEVNSDGTCKDDSAVEDMTGLSYTNGDKVFVDTTIKLYETESGEVFTSDQLYFGLTDIDAAQSYKIMNSDNLLTKNNMYALSEEGLQPSNQTVVQRNRFNANDHYIYAEYATDTIPFDIYDTGGNTVYVKTTLNAQRQGLNVIFGFGNSAGSGVVYYAKQYVVNYESDKNGEITGIETENIVSGHTPSGSESQPNENYQLIRWIADKDVTLTDGTTIEAGKPLTVAQIKKIVVKSDLTFMAIHEAEKGEAIAVPDTGIMTGETNGEIVIAGVAISVVLVMAILGNYAYQRKKHQVKF